MSTLDYQTMQSTNHTTAGDGAVIFDVMNARSPMQGLPHEPT